MGCVNVLKALATPSPSPICCSLAHELNWLLWCLQYPRFMISITKHKESSYLSLLHRVHVKIVASLLNMNISVILCRCISDYPIISFNFFFLYFNCKSETSKNQCVCYDKNEKENYTQTKNLLDGIWQVANACLQIINPPPRKFVMNLLENSLIPWAYLKYFCKIRLVT